MRKNPHALKYKHLSTVFKSYPILVNLNTWIESIERIRIVINLLLAYNSAFKIVEVTIIQTSTYQKSSP